MTRMDLFFVMLLVVKKQKKRTFFKCLTADAPSSSHSLALALALCLSVSISVCVFFIRSVLSRARSFVRCSRVCLLSLFFFLSVLPVLQFLPQYCAVTVFQNTDIINEKRGRNKSKKIRARYKKNRKRNRARTKNNLKWERRRGRRGN